MKSNRGVTLIVLVITIVVLIILAGVAVANLTGNNSIVDKAQESKEKSEEAKLNEDISLDEYKNKIEDIVDRDENNNTGEDTTYWQDDSMFIILTNNYFKCYFLESENVEESAISINNNNIYEEGNLLGKIEGNSLIIYWDYDPNDTESTQKFTKTNEIPEEFQSAVN